MENSDIILTIVAVSATIAAIVGGLVYNVNRRTHIHNNHLLAEQNNLNHEIEEGNRAASLFFVYGFINELIQGMTFNEIYGIQDAIINEIGGILPGNDMRVLWEHALEICHNVGEVVADDANFAHVDENNVPVILSNQYRANPVDYRIVQALVPRMMPGAHPGGQNQDDVLITHHAAAILQDMDNAHTFLGYRNNSAHLNETLHEVQVQLAHANNHGYVWSGLSIFSAYLIVCVILPLALCSALDSIGDTVVWVFICLFGVITISLIAYMWVYSHLNANDGADGADGAGVADGAE